MKQVFSIFVCIAMSIASPLMGQSFDYELVGSPVDITGWSMGGTAIVETDAIRLTNGTTAQNGYIHYATPQVLSGECAYFTVDFDYKIQNVAGSVAADGFAFWFLEDPPVGFVSGSGLGMPSILNGFAVVFDTYNNAGVSNVPTISIRKFETEGYDEEDATELIGTQLTSQTFVTDGTWRHVRLEYSLGTVSLFLDGSPTPNITGTLDLSGILGYFGFSASTGASYSFHHIKNVHISGAENPPAPNVIASEKVYCQFDAVPDLAVDSMLADGILHWYDVPTGGTELGAAPSIDSSVPDTFVYYVSQSRLSCPLESDRTAITVIIRPKPSLSINASSDKICFGGSIDLEAIITPSPDAGFSYIWAPPTGLSSTVTLTTTATPAVSTNYTFFVSSGPAGCDTTGSIYLQVIPNDITIGNNDTVVCSGTILPINATNYPDFYYAWTPASAITNPHSPNTAFAANESAWVKLIASHPGCPDVQDSFFVEVQPSPTLNLGDDRTICMGDTIHFFASTTPSYSGYTYDWTPGMKLTDSTIKDPVFIGYSDETYIVDVSTGIGCTDRDTIVVKVNRSDFLNLNVTDTTICGQEPIQLIANGAVTYHWSPSEGLSSDSISNPIANYGGSMDYLVTAISAEGCVDSQWVYIRQASNASISLPDSVSIYPGEQYEIDLVSNAHYFNWFPPEGLNDVNIANPIASPAVRTRYFVSAKTENGCTTVDSIDIIVNLESVWDMPNAFVPGNNYSPNPTFKVQTKGIVTLQSFKIYNRWGNEVFNTTDINEGWDGTYQGKPQPAGVYIYMVRAVTNTGQVLKKEGNLTLIR